ncbi:MAG: ribosome small subunit-dependent GTPase A [Proteobacteria bacterium]|nr:ribosome small subunit-dependent GTPase A [Pseudomonadota bacterium]
MIKDSLQSVEVGTVLSTSRRSVSILTSNYDVLAGQLSTKNLDVTVGDTVEYSISRGKPFVERTREPRNCLSRSYFGQLRRIVANVDHLFIGAAVPPLFNTTFIDRLLALARLEAIPATLLVNKVDLGIETASRVTSIYEQLGVDLLYTSAFSGEGIDALKLRLTDPTLRIAVLAGISGVGKSTIINLLIPSAQQRVGEVSEKTGQGRQTTAQPLGHLLSRAEGGPLIVVDLPGIQSFGVEHLDAPLIRAGFSEIEEIGQQCEYGDCSHTKEQHCAVKTAVDEGHIAQTRYQSYCDILTEIEAAKSY